MNETITKPMSLIRQELTEQIVDDINNCKLPLFVIEYILHDILDTVQSASKQQCEMEKMQYEELLKKNQADLSKQ